MGIDEKEWHQSQQRIFAADSVIEEALKNPIQRQRIDLAVKMIGGPNLRVLDIGAGDMAISELIKANGNQVVGVDLGEVIRTSREKNLDAVAGEAKKLPFADGTVDAALAGEIIEHQIDYRPFLSEAKRVLKQGGRLVLTTPNAARLRNRLAMIWGDLQPWHEWNKPIHHVRYWTFDTLQDALEGDGFQVLNMGTAMSQGEGCILEDPQSIYDFLRGQWSMELVEWFRRMVYSSFGVGWEERDTEKGWQACQMTRSFIIMEAKKI